MIAFYDCDGTFPNGDGSYGPKYVSAVHGIFDKVKTNYSYSTMALVAPNFFLKLCASGVSSIFSNKYQLSDQIVTPMMRRKQ